MTKHYFRDLEQVNKELLALGAFVEGAIHRAILALVDRRAELADDVIEGDVRIDAREVAFEGEVLKLLALHQPVASDLRFLVSVLKVNNDLERMGRSGGQHRQAGAAPEQAGSAADGAADRPN